MLVGKVGRTSNLGSQKKNAGKVEREAHKLLEKYKVERDYIYSGEVRNAKEIFECSIQTAIDAVKRAIDKNK